MADVNSTIPWPTMPAYPPIPSPAAPNPFFDRSRPTPNLPGNPINLPWKPNPYKPLPMVPVDPEDGDPTEAAIRNACQELADILIAKRRDYGKGNIAKHGITGILVRLDDKIARIENLTKSVKFAQNEPVADSWRDLAGYAIIGKLYIEGKW